MPGKIASFLSVLALLALSACCCLDFGVDGPQSHQYETVDPAQ